MRASSLSDRRVIELLSRYFVPVWLSTDDYGLVRKDKEEAEEYGRYRKLAKTNGLCAGNVQVYLIQPDGTLITTLHVAEAAKPEKLRTLLQGAVDEHHWKPREGDVRAGSSVRPRSRPESRDNLVLHVGVPHLGPRANLGLAENWVELSPQESATFTPKDLKAAQSWEVRPETAAKIYQCFFPPVGNYDASNGEVETASLTATATAVDNGQALVLLRGTVRLKHRIGGKQTDGEIRARVSGFYRMSTTRRKLTEFGLVTDEATFLWSWQGQPQPSKLSAFVELALTEEK